MRIIAGLLAIVLVVGCSDKDNVPSGIIPRDEMEKILWDMVQADQYAASYLLKDSARVNVKMETMKLYQEVFVLHQVSREEFRKSFRYYEEHPELTKNVFDSLLTRGNRLRAENYSRPVLTAPKPGVAPVVVPPATAPIFSKPGVTPGRPVMAPNPITGKPEMRVGPGTTPGKAPGKPVTLPGKPLTTPGKPATTDTVRGKHRQ